jgi:hypothetical protein
MMNLKGMRMFVHSLTGCSVQATLLTAGANILRVAVSGSDDISEYRWVSGQWLSEEDEPVALEFLESDYLSTAPGTVN